MARQATLTQEQWSNISTVLLDMDGTLLDLGFDNHFWLEHIPDLYALEQNISLENSKQSLGKLYQEYQGTLNWYCTDFWSERLQLDIINVKRSLAQGISIRPGTIEFLEMCQQQQKQLVLLTNAHPDTLRVKLDSAEIARYFELMISSHQLKQPKESLKFWSALKQKYQFDFKSTLFVDDSETILEAAKAAGVCHVRTICQPDLSQAKREDLKFRSVNKLSELFVAKG